MRKKIALTTLALIPMAVSGVYATSKIGIVKATSLNVRSGPSTSNNRLFTVTKNEKVEILETSGSWHKIKVSSNKIGWASASYIEISEYNEQENVEAKKIVNTNGLNMRSGPSTSYRVIKTLNKGNVVEIISESNGWSKIKHDGRLGYVASRYLDTTSSNVTPPTENPDNNQETVKTTKEVTASSLNVRSGPSTSYSIVGKLSKGSKIGVISESNGWSKVSYNGKVAYVGSTYLKEINNEQPPSTEKPEDNQETVKTTKEVTASSLNVRSGPSTSYSIVGKLSKVSKIGVISENNGWSKVTYNGKVAYVGSTYLKEINNEQPSSTDKPDISPVPPGDNSENTNGATINYKDVSYTLNDHIEAQYQRVSLGGNVIDSTKPRAMSVSTPMMIRGFIPAQKEDLEYFLNPNNFTNSKKGVLQFLRIDSYKSGISAEQLNTYLNSLPAVSNGTNIFYNQGATFINAAQKYDIDLVYLVSHAMWETGYGRSTLAQGQTITSYKGEVLPQPVTVYNFFGIGAIDKSANVSGAEAAYSNGWTSIDATIDGSAKWIAENYIKNPKYNQNTIYKMKFNYDYTWHQYATDVNWANGISRIMEKIIGMYSSGNNLVFEVPNYK